MKNARKANIANRAKKAKELFEIRMAKKFNGDTRKIEAAKRLIESKNEWKKITPEEPSDQHRESET